MAERVDEKTEREIEALLDKLIVQKVCAGVKADLESQGQELSEKLEGEREKVENVLSSQGFAMEEKFDTLKWPLEECGRKLDTLSADGKQLDNKLNLLDQGGKQLTETLDGLSRGGEHLNKKLNSLSQGGERLNERLDSLTQSEKRLEKKLGEGKTVLEKKLMDVAQAVSVQADADRTQAEDFRKEDKERWERLFRDQGDKFQKLWRVMLILFCLQIVGIVLAIAQLMR